MNCLEALNISAGVTSIIGSGGKTTLLRAIADELHQTNPETHIILATTTHFLPFIGVELYLGDDEAELANLLDEHKIICVGNPVEPKGTSRCSSALDHGDLSPSNSDLSPLAPGKLGPSPISVERLAQLADYVLVEADGSKRLPLKAHAEHEPVVPECSNQTILVLSASGFWKPVNEVVHRPEIFCELVGCSPDAEVTPALAGRAIATEIMAKRIAPSKVVINQIDSVSLLQTPEVPQLNNVLEQAGLNIDVFTASIQEHRMQRIIP